MNDFEQWQAEVGSAIRDAMSGPESTRAEYLSRHGRQTQGAAAHFIGEITPDDLDGDLMDLLDFTGEKVVGHARLLSEAAGLDPSQAETFVGVTQRAWDRFHEVFLEETGSVSWQARKQIVARVVRRLGLGPDNMPAR